MGSGRGVVRMLAATLLFLVLELLYGVALMVLCVLMLGGLGLLLLCICSTSTRSSRVFVAWMWRNELWLNGLVVDKQERASSRGYERVSSESHLPTQAARREVTSSVMIFSVLYFLVFRGIFNVVFSVFPLAMWYAALIQAVPSAALESDMVVGAEISSRLFVALVTSFFAYQVSVASARASVLVSEKIQSVLFREPAYPTTETNALRQNSGITQYDSARQDNVLPELFLHENRYGDELRPRSVGRPFPQDARWPARGGAPSSSSSAPPPPAPPPPPMPPMPPMSGGYPYGPPPHARDRQHPLDEEFRADTNVHEYDFCGVKVLLRRESDPDELSPRRRDRHDAPWRRGRHRGYDDRGGMGRRGGRGAHGGRGSFYYYQEEPYPVQVESVPAVSDTAHEPVGPPAKYTASISKPSCNDRSRGRRRDERSSRGRSDSVDRGFSRAQADLDLKHGHRSRLCEALDLRPSAPPLSESHQDEFGSPWRSELYPMARPAELYPLRVEPPVMSRHIQKSMSDMGRQRMDEEDVFEGSRKLDFIATKQMWKEHARRLKLEAKRIKNAYKAKWKQDARDLKEKQKEQDRILKEQEWVIKEQERLLKEREQLARAGEIAADKPCDAALPGRAIPNQGLTVGGPKPSSVRHTQRQEQYQAGVPDDDEEKQSIRVQEDFAMEIQQAAQEQVEKQQQELLFDSRKTGTLHTSTNSNVTVSADASDEPRSGTRPIIRGRRLSALNDIDLLMFGSSTDDSRVDIAPSSDYRTFASNLFQTGVSMDQEFGRMYDSYSRSMESYSRSIDDRDYTGLDRFNDVYSATPIAITSLQTPLYRSTNGAQGLPSGRSVSGYDTFSPESSPRGSFIVNSFVDPHPYDSMSPTGNRPEAEFPSEDFQQVYRSLRYRDDNRVVPSQISSLPNYEDVPGERDKVHFCSYAPPSVFPSKQSFRFAVWAFLLNQKQEMREQAEASDPEARQMSMDAKMVVRRGAFVHVTLEVPTGFRILNEPTQGLPWEGTISHIDYDILCTDEADFGQVVFKATIVVGTEVAVLRSYMIVSSKKLEASELDAKVLESQLEVLEVTYQEVPYPMLELKELVGSGYFGDAYRATYNGQDVVVKTIRASEFGETNDQILKEFQHEAAVLSMFGHHPCVVPFVGASTDMRYPLSLITQYLPYGSLEDNLKTPEKQSSLSVRQRSSMLRDAAAGLLNVHEGGFIHRDIAARNCLVDENLRVKICDFGLCRRVNAYGGSLMKDSVGPIKYMAPESLQLPHSFSFDSDSWMFGVLMWETYNASPPYPDMTPLQAGMSVLRGDRLPIPQHIPQRLQELIQSCFLDAPSDRPSMGDIVSELDQYLTSTNVASSTARSLQPSANVIGNSAVPSMVLGTSHAALERRDRSIWV